MPDLERLEALGRKFADMLRHAKQESTPLVALQAEELFEFLLLLDMEHEAMRAEDYWQLSAENERLRAALQDISLGEENADPGWSKARRALTWELREGRDR